jgi:hypothetical protein
VTENPWTPDALERVVMAAVEAGDARGVEAALTVMAPMDPHRAQRLFDELKAAAAEPQLVGYRTADGKLWHPADVEIVYVAEKET